VHPDAWIAPNAIIVDNVSLGERAGVWYGAVIRGDAETIRIGAQGNVQDN
jgi:carbonic anhydrase/acetyltransferase-like protein (isoleucine patch superfamily)